MSVKLSKRPSSKKKKPLKDNAQAEVLHKLGLEAYQTTPLDPASMLDISTWTLESDTALNPKDLPKSFLQRLWLLRADARSTFCLPQHDVDSHSHSLEETCNGFEEEIQPVVNPLDLVTAVFMSANTFLQQEMTIRMVQCQFAIPLVLPNIDPNEPSQFLLWPSRGVVSQWMSLSLNGNRKAHEGDLATTCMPVISCIKLGRCGVSKSQVLNCILSGPTSVSDAFFHKGLDGGQLPRRVSNGLVELGWYLPTGDIRIDKFPIPVVFSNLRGDASVHEKSLSLLCQASSVVVVFCGDLKEKDKQVLISCKHLASKLILIDSSDTENDDSRVVGFDVQNLDEHMGLPEGSVLSGKDLNENEIANKLCISLKNLLADQLKFVTLEAMAKVAVDIGLNVDEGPICKKALTTVMEVLNGLDQGSSEFKLNQLPLQGHLWSRLSELEKQESKQKKDMREIDPQLKKEKKGILAELSSYKMTPSMKIFTNALFTADKVERMYFLSWLKLKLQQMQYENLTGPQDVLTKLYKETKAQTPELLDEMENGVDDNLEDSDSFCTDSSLDEETDVLPGSYDLQVYEEEIEKGEESLNILQVYEKSDEPQPENIEDPESNHNPVILQELDMESAANKNQDEQMAENNICGDEQYSQPGLENRISRSESGYNETVCCRENQPDEPMVPVSLPSVNSSDVNEMCPDASFENNLPSTLKPFEPDPSSLGLEHFLREMGLIFELTHISPGSGSHNVLRLPSLATDLLLYGIPLELMDGDASNISVSWLCCVFAELKRRLPQERCRTRVLTNLGVHHARNAETLSALFGVKFPDGRRRSSQGVYMLLLCLPENIRQSMECDYLLLIDVEGLGSVPLDNKENVLVHDNAMATFATGLSDVLLHNICSEGEYELETNIAVLVSALLHSKESGSIPICQLLVQDVEINSVLQASQLRRVSEILQPETDGKDLGSSALVSSCTTCISGPWSKVLISEPVDSHFSEALVKLKKNLFEALKLCSTKSKASGLPSFLKRLCAVWETVKAESYSFSLQNTDIALAFSLLCTKLAKWNNSFLEAIEIWLMEATKKIFATKVKALNASVQIELLSELKNEVSDEIKTEVGKVKSKVEAHLVENEPLKTNAETFRPILMCYICNLQDKVTEEMKQRLEKISESHCSSTQLNNFQTLLEKEQKSVLHALLERSKSSQIPLQDSDLEDEFEGVWSKALSIFDFRPSDADNITARVIDVLRENLVSRGLQKHMKKLDVIDKTPSNGFRVYDEHFGYRSRLKHMFDDNNRPQRVKAQQLASQVIEEYNQFVVNKYSILADFSDSYITELLELVEKALKENSMEIRSAFEVDLKVYLCNAASQDFQKLHDRFAKDRDLLTCITETKSMHSAEFMYHFRKRDQCHRLAQAFTSTVFKPTILDYINKPLGTNIAEEILKKAQQFQSPQAFHQCLLEGLLKEDRFESFLQYLSSYDEFRLSKIQEVVKEHLSESTNICRWRQRRLGEIVGKIAAAVSQTTEGKTGVLTDAKPLLESVCLTLERDADIVVNNASLTGPLFSFRTEWDCFVKYLMEFLATIRLNLAQEFAQNVDVTQLLDSLPIQPQDCLFDKVRGCDKRCPFCCAPCDDETGHEVHMSLLHRPKGMFPYNSSALASVISLETMTEGNSGQNTEVQEVSLTCHDLFSLHPDWTASSSDPKDQKISNYWRYVLMRFNEKFAKEFEQEPVKIPEEWTKLTQEEVLDGLK